MDQSKFALNISKYLVRFSELDLDIYDFRKQDFEDEEDLRHHILLCKELAYFERKRLQEVGFKFDEEWLLSGQEPYSRIKVALKTLYFIGSYVWRKFKGKLKNKRILYKKYTDYHEFFSDHLHKYPFKGAGDRYVLTSYVSSRIEVLKKLLQVKEMFSCDDILECGCGGGINLILLNRLYGVERISGFEYTAARYASVLANLEISDVQLGNFFLADIRKLPIRDNSFDLVFTCHVLEQLKQDLEEAIGEAIRIARKAVVLCEPSNFKATLVEKLYLRDEGYCENLIDIVRKRKDVEITEHSKRAHRQWLNPSNFIVMKKI